MSTLLSLLLYEVYVLEKQYSMNRSILNKWCMYQNLPKDTAA